MTKTKAQRGVIVIASDSDDDDGGRRSPTPEISAVRTPLRPRSRTAHPAVLPQLPRTPSPVRTTRSPRRRRILDAPMSEPAPKRMCKPADPAPSTPQHQQQRKPVLAQKQTGRTAHAPPVRAHLAHMHSDLECARDIILQRLSGSFNRSDAAASEIPLDGDAGLASKKLYDMLKRTVETGESNSVLVVGAHGTGKTAAIRAALTKLAAETAKQTTPKNSKPFLEITLNGLVHTDDKLALRSMVKQLRLEANIVGRIGSFSDTLAFMLETLKAGNTSSTPIVITIDEMDLFASHAKQALLYNLFDIAQKNENPIAVVGLTSRLDTIELFEKRVKSRFSHRLIYTHAPNTIEAYTAMAQSALELGPNMANESNHSHDGENRIQGCTQAFIDAFNQSVRDTFADVHVSNVLRRMYSVDRTISTLFRVCAMAVCALSPTPTTCMITPQVFCNVAASAHLTDAGADRKIDIVHTLSVLELCLVIAARHLLARQVMMFNFEMVYDEYREFAQRAAMSSVGSIAMSSSVSLNTGSPHTDRQRAQPRSPAQVSTPTRRATSNAPMLGDPSIFFVKRVALKAFESLLERGLFASHDTSRTALGSAKEYRMVTPLLTRSQITDAVAGYRSACPESVLRWGLSE